jgi:phage tail-like protein
MADQLLRSFRFQVKLRKSTTVESGSQTPSDSPSGTELGDGAFQECSGLEIELDVQEYLEGGRNDGVIRHVGRAKYSPIILKRGMFYPSSGRANRDLWLWIQSIATGERPVARYDGTVKVMSVGEDVSATWVFDRGLPMKVRGPELNAKTGEVAIEELHIVHEGLRLVSS